MIREQIILQQLKEWAEKQEVNPSLDNPFTKAFFEGIEVAKSQALTILTNLAQ